LNGDTLATHFPALHKHGRRKNRTVAEAIANNRWIVDIDYNLTLEIIMEYVQLSDELENITLIESEPDSITWVLSPDGTYSAKSAYDLHFLGQTKCLTASQTWKAKAPPKCKFFIWLMLQNRIWTAARLLIRGWPNEYFCQLCLKNLETTHHLFCECPMATEIWTQVGNWAQAASLMPSNWNQTADLKEWFTELVASAAPSARSGLWSLTVLTIWEIWIERNARVFRRTARSAQQVVSSIQDEARNWVFAGNRGLDLLLQANVYRSHVSFM
jgi:hypothetical protein